MTFRRWLSLTLWRMNTARLYFKNWWLFWLPLNIPNVTVHMRNGLKFKVRGSRHPDIWLFREIFHKDVYRLNALAVLRDSLSKEVTSIVDVGANIGLFTCYAARLYPQAIVYAVEPQKENADLIRENARLNKLENIQVLQQAVGTLPGFTSLYVNEKVPFQTTTFKDWADFMGDSGLVTKEVRQITLESLQPFDVLKIDAEGAEYLVADQIPFDLPYLAIEVHPFPGHPEAYDRFVGSLAEHYTCLQHVQHCYVYQSKLLFN